ncbi:cytosolic Fe-S cluster assembly factor cfd1 [Tilletia horrida]|nr:cytosolic Fe-S cluster assembly factor cfd1 [Tilletia horrida]KAK0559757.1 cytosolic Fe-S cluster assembly factor cfd1 [Tilletia horrida]
MSATPVTPQTEPKLFRRLSAVHHVILVLSGKGGVGKSSVTTQLALSLASTPLPSAPHRLPNVGVLDVDLTGPSIPRMLGLDTHTVKQSSDGWVPVYLDPANFANAAQSEAQQEQQQQQPNLGVMSVGFLLRSKNDSVVWRGPKKNAMIRQFLGDVRWGELDYLIIDTPPGTSDEHISLMTYLAPFQPTAVLVTTPQALSLTDNLRSLSFCRTASLPLLGIIENMSGYVCPHCAECTNVWGKGGGEALAQREGIPFLGRIPIDPGLVRVLDDAKGEAKAAGADPEMASKEGEEEGAAAAAVPQLTRTLLARYTDSQTFPIFKAVVGNIMTELQKRDGNPLATRTV